MKYNYRFWGRLRGSIGIFYFIEGILQATDEESARLTLRDRYEAGVIYISCCPPK